MSFIAPTQNHHYGAMPNPQNTTGAQYYLMQTLGQGVQRVPVPHPTEHLARRAARLRRRHQLQMAFAQGANQNANQNANAHRVRPRHRGNTLHVRETEFERRLKDQAKELERNLKRYGTSDPKELILKADIFLLGDVLRACTPKQLKAMHEIAVALKKENEDVPAHTAELFNTLMGREIMMPLEARTFEIALR